MKHLDLYIKIIYKTLKVLMKHVDLYIKFIYKALKVLKDVNFFIKLI